MVLFCILLYQTFVGFENVLFGCVLIWILTIEEYSRIKLFLFEDIFEEWNETIVLDEYYDASSFLSQADDLGDHLKADFFELFHVFLVISGLVVEYDLFISYLFEDGYTTLLLLDDMRIFFNKHLMFKSFQERSEVIQRLHGPSSYYGQSAFTDNFLQLFTLQT